MVGGSISVRMLGGFDVEVDGRPIPSERWRRRRAADLVKLLALGPGHRLGREQLMDAIWPDLPPDRAGANLRKAAYHARKALGVSDGVSLDGMMVELGKGRRVGTDVVRFEQAVGAALGSGSTEACRSAAALYGGVLLPGDLYASWSTEFRSRLADSHVRVLEGGELWGRLVQVDPTHERAHQEIIRAHLANRDRASALRQFEDLRVALRDHLGVLPSRSSMELYEEALSLDAPDTPTAAERARALLAWGVVHWERHDMAEATRAASEARALAIDAGLGRELTEASELLGLIAYAQGKWRTVFAEQFIESMRHTPEMTPFLYDAHMCMSEFALCEVDGIRDVAELAEAILATALDVGSRQGTALGLLLRGEAAMLGATDPTPAAEDLTEAAHLHQEIGSLTGWALALERLAQTEAVAGNRSASARRHRRALELAEGSPVPRHLVPFVYGGMLDGGGSVTTFAVVEEAAEAMSGLDVCDPCAMGFRVGAVHTCLAAGELDAARSYLAEAERVSTMWPGGPWHAAISEAGAAIRRHQEGDPDEIARLLEDAAAGFAAASRPRDEARCRRALATWYEHLHRER